MFRRLAEAFADADPHSDYINQQSTYFNTLPNMILSPTSGLPGLTQATRSVGPNGVLQDHVIPHTDDIVMTGSSKQLSDMQAACSAGSLDDLLAAKNPNSNIGCGWMYTPPNKGSPYPIVQKGALGNEKGPFPLGDIASHKKWFFDLEKAKQQTLLDKCKALKSCNDVDQDIYRDCGYCTDTNQGIPLTSAGLPRYPADSRGNCSPASIVRQSSSCPPPPSGPQPPRDKTCDVVNGRVSASCLYNNVIAGGCSDNGSLAIALQTSSPSDYLSAIRDSDAVKIYQRAANPPMNLNVFTQGQTTVDAVLREVRQLASHTNEATTSALGASSRDLCFKRGAISLYDQCINLPDGTLPPFDVACLQKLFRLMGGQPAGSAYPSPSNLDKYHAMGTLGAVKQSWANLISNMKGTDAFVDYATQRDAMSQFLGIVPEDSIIRAPFSHGVEVFWFVPVPGQPNKIIGFLKRTIEPDFIQLNPGPSSVKQIGGGAFGCCVQLTDVWTPADCTVKFRVLVDDGFWIAVNQPANIDGLAMERPWATLDEPGLFQNLGMQGPTWYEANKCTALKASTPNVTKVYYEDGGGGWNAFVMNAYACSGTSPFVAKNYSLTCEGNAPFLTYEVGKKSGVFEELRNPGLFGQFLGVLAPDYHTRTDEKQLVPGKKSFVRLTCGNSAINMPNIAFQSWKTMTFAIRPQSMPAGKETLLHIFPGGSSSESFAILATRVDGSTIGISVEYNSASGSKTIATPYTLQVGAWYMFYVNNMRTSFDLYCNYVDGFLSSNGSATMVTLRGKGTPLWGTNATWNPAPGQMGQPCNLLFGGGLFGGQWGGIYGSSAFVFDLAWVHFFDQLITKEGVVRECKGDWIYTQFVDSYANYRTLDA